MCHRPRPLRVGNPKLFLRLPLLRSSSHRHARSLRTSALDYARNFTSESRLSPRTDSRGRASFPARSRSRRWQAPLSPSARVSIGFSFVLGSEEKSLGEQVSKGRIGYIPDASFDMPKYLPNS